MINAMSVDLEYWWSIEFLKDAKIGNIRNDLMIESVHPLLSLLNKYDVRSTFFVVGHVAKNYPELVEQINDQGHEIAFHGYSHRTLYEMNMIDFEREIDLSMRYLAKYNPIGFRAPSFSLSNDTLWALKILANRGFKYDSSVYPIRTMLYGVPNAPVCCYRPSSYDISVNDPEGDLKEIPLTVARLGKLAIPVAGGFFLRILPFWFLEKAISLVNKERPAVVYIHPWETLADLPRYNAKLFYNFINYYGISSALNKLEGLFKIFQFEPIKDVFL